MGREMMEKRGGERGGGCMWGVVGLHENEDQVRLAECAHVALLTIVGLGSRLGFSGGSRLGLG